RDVVMLPAAVRLRPEQDPADADEHRQEAEHEHAGREARRSVLRPAADELRERHHEAGARDDAHRDPEVVDGARAEVGAGDPDEPPAPSRDQRRRQATREVVRTHSITSFPFQAFKRERDERPPRIRYSSARRRVSKRAEYSSEWNSSTVLSASSGNTCS